MANVNQNQEEGHLDAVSLYELIGACMRKPSAIMKSELNIDLYHQKMVAGDHAFLQGAFEEVVAALNCFQLSWIHSLDKGDGKEAVVEMRFGYQDFRSDSKLCEKVEGVLRSCAKQVRRSDLNHGRVEFIASFPAYCGQLNGVRSSMLNAG